ncbi:hypothetical protein [Sinorhizobium meliloti]|uniref:hypothetical protein n=1 Tax=Rhizobium meliloti TaxID=382 RepID=UPI000B49A0B6|nr:hypothetical protein [Sinorhizobium meliloti]ASQ13134.1 hypothetical protein CDO22_24630 [Sinorhizobium meliloti]MQU84804.1 hypothetical protein [Sinorhizobium meliloti]MQU86390.1 hypothetical protein [Sinorhizobium meliloti]
MLDERVKITDLADKRLLRDRLGYVRKVLLNCYGMYQSRGWKIEHIRVRIGRTGSGSAPHYQLEYVSEDFDLSKTFVETRFLRRSFPQQFSGQNHEKKGFGFAKESWSTELESVASLEELRERLFKTK